jgi:hypothetical protein
LNFLEEPQQYGTRNLINLISKKTSIMNNKLKADRLNNLPKEADIGKKQTENAASMPYARNPERRFFTKEIDPRILQRYSFDDNGGGYKGL